MRIMPPDARIVNVSMKSENPEIRALANKIKGIALVWKKKGQKTEFWKLHTIVQFMRKLENLIEANTQKNQKPIKAKFAKPRIRK